MRPVWPTRWPLGANASNPPILAEPSFDVARAVRIAHADELSHLTPGIRRSLHRELDVMDLSNRMVPAQMQDDRVAIFALAEHVGSDQADALTRRVTEFGYRLAATARFIVAPPLLLAICRGQVDAASAVQDKDAESIGRTPALARAFHDLLDWGVRHDASDLHINVRKTMDEAEVKYTIAGRYVAPDRFRRLPPALLLDMLSVAWMDIRGGNGAVFDPSVEQQGALAREIAGQAIILRWSSMAADDGPSVCLRLLHSDVRRTPPTLDALGYLPEQQAQIERVLRAEGGAIVFSGTVGSGKSTTLASLISGLPTHRKIITLEDPVEYRIPRAIQNTIARNLDVDAHDGFATKLRALKRSAMTDVLLGEVRDVETGRALMDLAGSGVNVYTTVHAPSAALIPHRLASDFIRVSWDFLRTAGMLKLLVHQALLPKLCPACALPVESLQNGGPDTDGRMHTAAWWERWWHYAQRVSADAERWRIRNVAGCESCRQPGLPELAGYVGRTVVAEIIEPALENQPGLSGLECALVKAADGLIDPRDIEQRYTAFETLALRASTASKPTSMAAIGMRQA